MYSDVGLWLTMYLFALNAFSSVHKPLFNTQIFMCAVGLRVMSIDTPCHALVNVLEGQAQVGIECNYSHLHTRVYFIQGCPVEIQHDTVWQQQERPAACVIAQQDFPSPSTRWAFIPAIKNLTRIPRIFLFLIIFCLLKIASIWNCPSWGLFRYLKFKN
jgi:hypothetical protein